jgi:putative toxin-antitoxin system antitoxin component (TIGR02293 family)
MWRILCGNMAQEKPMPTRPPKTAHPQQKRKQIDRQDYGTLFCGTRYGFAPLKSQRASAKARQSREPAWGHYLGLHLHSREEVIEHLENGLTMDAFEHFSKAIDIPLVHLATIANIARRTLTRRKQEGRLQLAESERLFRFANLFDKAVEVFGDEDRARRWLKTPLKALAGTSPIEYAGTEIGAREVEDLLGRLEHGVFS